MKVGVEDVQRYGLEPTWVVLAISGINQDTMEVGVGEFSFNQAPLMGL